MMLRSLFVAFLAFSSAAPVLAQAARPAAAPTAAPSDRAKQWLTLVDDKNYQQSWTESGPAFKARQKAEEWSKSAAALRAPMGAMSSRDLKSIDASRNNIAVVRYDTVFAHKATAIETITLTYQSGGQNGGWAVTDYAIQ